MEDEELHRFSDKTEIQQARLLWRLAKAGKPREDVARWVPLLMLRYVFNGRLSHWAYHALTEVSPDPSRHLVPFLKEMTRERPPTNVAKDGVGVLYVGPPDPRTLPPRLPRDLEEANRIAWRSTLSAVLGLLLSPRPGARATLSLKYLEGVPAPHEVMADLIAGIIQRDDLDEGILLRLLDLLGQHGNSRAAFDAVRPHAFSEVPRVRAGAYRALGHLRHLRSQDCDEGVHPVPVETTDILIRAFEVEKHSDARSSAFRALYYLCPLTDEVLVPDHAGSRLRAHDRRLRDDRPQSRGERTLHLDRRADAKAASAASGGGDKSDDPRVMMWR